MVGLRTVSVSRLGVPTYRLTMPIYIPIGIHRVLANRVCNP
jgi:hypothetical protein